MSKKTATVALIVIFIACAMLIALSATAAATPVQTMERFDYQVKPGDTLWSLSAAYSGDQSRMEWILEVMDYNGMDDETIYAEKTIELYRLEE